MLFQSFALRFDNGREKKKEKNIKIDSSHRSLIRHDLINPRLEILSARFLPYFVFRVSTLLDLVSVYKSCESSEEPPPGSGETPSQGRRERRWRGRKKRGTSEWNIIDSIIARVRILPGSGLAPQGNPPSVRNASATNVTFDFTIFGAWPDLSKTFHTISSREKGERKKKEKRNNLLIFLLLSNARAQTFTLSNDRALRFDPDFADHRREKVKKANLAEIRVENFRGEESTRGITEEGDAAE